MLIKVHNHQSLIFKKSQKPLKLEGFCDADWADRKSVSRYCFRLADNNPMISWKFKKQNSVTLSTCEMKFITIWLAIQEALHLRALLRIMTELESLKHPTTIYCDNQSSIVLEKKRLSLKDQNIDIKFQFICEEINKGSILLESIETKKNVVDMFTKPMTRTKLNTFRKIIEGIQS